MRRPVEYFSLNAAATLAALFLGTAFLGGCADKPGGTIPYHVQNFGTPDAPPPVAVNTVYRVAPLDTLKVTVPQASEVAGDYDVDLAGNINLPLVGNVKAADLTVPELQRSIATSLARYVKQPQVFVGVKASSRQHITVDGAVRQPGIFPLSNETTLIETIAMAHGADENANIHRVAIFRQINGHREAAAFDLERIRRGLDPDPKVYIGDIVIVDGSKNKELTRQLLQAIPLASIFRPF